MPEGQFPKSGGAPLYYTEANRFAGGNVLFMGSSAFIQSGTAYQTLGSVLISGNMLTNLSNPFNIYFYVVNRAGNPNNAFRIAVSGTSTNASFQLNDAFIINELFIVQGHIVTGSPFEGRIWGHGISAADNTNDRTSQAAITNLNLTQNFTIEFLGKTNGSVAIANYSIGIESNNY